MSSEDDTVDSETRPPMVVRGCGLTDPGRKRPTNEDCFAIAELARTLHIQHTNLPQPTASTSLYRGHVLLVADGVGGNNAGEVASGLGVATIEDFMLNTLRRFFKLAAHEEQAALRALQDALREADSRIFREQARHPEWHGMGTTLTMCFAVHWRLLSPMRATVAATSGRTAVCSS